MPDDLFGRVSTVDTGERSALDYYATPSWMTRSLLHFHPAIAGTAVIEPCSGDDAITSVLRDEFGCTVYTNDLNTCHPAQAHHDARDPAFWLTAAPSMTDWVITNPPFAAAFPILTCAIQHARVGVAFLLRKTFLEPTDDRGSWLMAHPPTRVIGLPRYAFRGKGSDSVSADWMIWERETALPRRIERPPFVIDYVAERRTRVDD